MNEPIEIAQENARRNHEQITRQLPKSLVQKEDKLFQRISNHKGNAFTKLKAVYELMDELYSFTSKFTPCKKGCNSCCHYPISISELEIDYIESSSQLKRLNPPRPKSDFHGNPCPFLTDGACSIYQIRPFVCRQHIALTKTSTWCDPDRSNSAELTQLRFSEVTKSYDLIINQNGKASRFDIRQVF